jgi:hypothetical protein
LGGKGASQVGPTRLARLTRLVDWVRQSHPARSRRALSPIQSACERPPRFCGRPDRILVADNALTGESEHSISALDGASSPARVVGRDPSIDVALQVERTIYRKRRLRLQRRRPEGSRLSPAHQTRGWALRRSSVLTGAVRARWLPRRTHLTRPLRQGIARRIAISIHIASLRQRRSHRRQPRRTERRATGAIRL